jgi:hypothetical protein
VGHLLATQGCAVSLGCCLLPALLLLTGLQGCWWSQLGALSSWLTSLLHGRCLGFPEINF